jgi:hypothetical protein
MGFLAAAVIELFSCRDAAACQVAVKGADTEAPRRQLVAALHVVDQRAERRAADGDAVAQVVGKAGAFLATVLDRL